MNSKYDGILFTKFGLEIEDEVLTGSFSLVIFDEDKEKPVGHGHFLIADQAFIGMPIVEEADFALKRVL